MGRLALTNSKSNEETFPLQFKINSSSSAFKNLTSGEIIFEAISLLLFL